MRFEGEVWFDFRSTAVWIFYRFVRSLAADGHEVTLEWKPLPVDDERAAMALHASLDDPDERGRFLHAMLGLVHLEGQDPADPETVRRALDACGLSPEINLEGRETALARLEDAASQLAIRRVPTLYRHGPATTIVLNAAALEGDLAARAATILAMTDDDGIWELTKP
jgi:2-hydroxychromene-2-carboxylate isomerase